MTHQTNNTAPAIEAEGLVKHFGDNRAVDGVNLKVPTGSIYGVLGPNGAGKTTTIRILATLLKADAGVAYIFGHDVRKEANIVRQLVGLTGQYASVDETLSATENLVIFGMLLGLNKKQAKRKAAELLEEFSLTEAANRAISKFSGGMRRRLDLAASLIAQPPLIFLDEPTTGLDPIMTDVINELILQTRARRPVTSVIVTHEMRTVQKCASRVVMLYPRSRLGADERQILYDGPPGGLATAEDARVRQFVEGEAKDRLAELGDAP